MKTKSATHQRLADLLLLLVALAVAGCRANPVTRVVLLQPTATLAATAVPCPVPTAIPAWHAYQFPNGVVADYPAGWAVEPGDVPLDPSSAWFRPADPTQRPVGVEVYHRPLAERGVSDPYTWQPNEGGYEVHWSQVVQSDGLDGILFVWGVRRDSAWETPPWLMAILYSPQHELEVRLTTEFTPSDVGLAHTVGLADVVAGQFGDFVHMVASVRIEPAGALVTFMGIVRTGAELGEGKSYCTQGLYLVPDGADKLLLLQVSGPAGEAAVLSDSQFAGQRVIVTGRYPAQEFSCEALLCECEDYILVTQIQFSAAPADASLWPVFEHNALGVQISYPAGWDVDTTPAFVRFADPERAEESFDVVNAGFPMEGPADFLVHLGLPTVATETLTLDGQPALYVELGPSPAAEGYRSVVVVITPDGRGLTLGNRTDRETFERAVHTVRFFTPTEVTP